MRKLTGTDDWQLRMGDWRARFRPDLTNRILVLLHVRPRGRAYRD